MRNVKRTLVVIVFCGLLAGGSYLVPQWIAPRYEAIRFGSPREIPPDPEPEPQEAAVGEPEGAEEEVAPPAPTGPATPAEPEAPDPGMPLEEEVLSAPIPLRDIDANWIQREVERNRDRIDQADLERGVALFAKLDASYLFGLSRDGFSEQDRRDALAYLHQELEEDEVDLAWGLFQKYVELIE